MIEAPLSGEDIETIAADNGVKIERCGWPQQRATWASFKVRAHLQPRPYVFDIPSLATIEDAREIVAAKAREMRGRLVVEFILRGDWDPHAADDVEEQELEAAAVRMMEWLAKRRGG